jgi:hypothetical protein
MLRFVHPVIEKLAEEGHRLHVSFAIPEGDLKGENVRELAAHSGVEVSALALEQPDRLWANITKRVLQPVRDLASYTTFRSRWSPLMRERWLEYFPRWLGLVVLLIDRMGLGAVIESRVTRKLTAAVATRWPVPEAMRSQLSGIDPDVVVVSPMIYSGSREVDALRVARAKGIPTIGVVLSWDNLTSKGSFHARPDSLLVWNEAQVREAVTWHGFDVTDVEALGAPAFDYLFERASVPAREALLTELGLAPDDSYVLYAVSSRLGLGTGGEVPIALEVARAIRAREWGGRPPTVVVRPHPRNTLGWDRISEPGVLVWRRPAFPDTASAKSDLLASLVHADAVIGLNTSFFIDAAIVGTPAIALGPGANEHHERNPTQVSHFEHLLKADFMHLVDDPSEAARVLADVLENGDCKVEQRRAFVTDFIRPHSLDRPAAEVVAERLASVLR